MKVVDLLEYPENVLNKVANRNRFKGESTVQ